MKNKTIISLLLIGAMLFCFGVISTKQDVVYAEQSKVFVSGESELTVKADTMEIEFFVKEVTENFSNGQDKISGTFDCMQKSLKQIDENIVCTITCMCCNPRMKKDSTMYEFEMCINVCTSQLDKLEEIIKTAGECGAKGYSGVFYSIKDKKNLFDNAIEGAKLDAINKARNMDKELELDKLFVQDVYCFEQNSNIVVKAVVKANFVKVQKSPEVTTKEYMLNQDDLTNTNLVDEL